MTLQQKKQIEQDILKHKTRWLNEESFVWHKDDTVTFKGSLYIKGNVKFNAPNLTHIGGNLYIHTNVKFNAPILTHIGGHLAIHSNVKLPNLTHIGGHLSIGSDVKFNAPNLTHKTSLEDFKELEK